MISDQENILLTAEALAARIQVTPKTIRNWHLQGRIPAAVCVGRVLRFDPDEVADALRTAAREEHKKRARLMEII